MIGLATLTRLGRETRGTMAIETAIVAPLLALMGLGTYDVANMVSKQQDLQSAASEATQIVLAAANGDGVTSDQLHDIIAASLQIDGDKVQLAQLFRCDDDPNTVTDASTCNASKPIYQYVQLTITDSYTPLWTEFGVGQTIDYNVVRTIQTK